MASAYLSEIQMLNNQVRTSSAADTALCAFEKGMFGVSHNKVQEQTNESNPDSLSYLFSIFAY